MIFIVKKMLRRVLDPRQRRRKKKVKALYNDGDKKAAAVRIWRQSTCRLTMIYKLADR